jgi:Cu2+-exporting ATPase
MNHEHYTHQRDEQRHPSGADHAGHHGDHDHGAMIADFRRRFWISLILTLPILALSPAIQGFLGLDHRLHFAGSTWISLVLASAVFFYGGWPFLAGLVAEVSNRQPGMMTLIGLAITVAYVYSASVVLGLAGEVFFWETATLIDVMLLGHWIEMRSVLGASAALEALVRLLPATAHRLKADGSTEEVPISALKPGDRVLAKPGEKVPVDGIIREGRSTLNEAMLTGESKPVGRGPGMRVIGGSINGEGALIVEIDRTGDQTYLAQVIELVRQAQASRSRTQDLANRAALWLTYVALGTGGLTFAAWYAAGEGLAFALERMVTVMVICCPHALGLAVPLVVAVSTSLGARNGLLIRDRAAFERAHELDAIVFDKTGTLTQGAFGVGEVAAPGDATPEEILRLAAAVEAFSEHPIAQAIVRASRERGISPPTATGFRNLPGEGAEATVEGRRIRIVSPGYVARNGIAGGSAEVERMSRQGYTVIYVLDEDRPIGVIGLADLVRPESRAAIARLKAMGLRCLMLTGDSRAVAEAVAAELGLDDFFAEVLPHQKAERIRELQARGLRVAMVGDGVNDAPALVQSDLGVAIGAGTDVAIESADIVLVRSDPRDVPMIIGLASATYRKMVQNLLWATGYNAIAIPLAAGIGYPFGVLLSPAVGAALMSASTVIVAINAQMLQRSGARLTREARDAQIQTGPSQDPKPAG